MVRKCKATKKFKKMVESAERTAKRKFKAKQEQENERAFFVGNDRHGNGQRDYREQGNNE